MFDDDDDDLIGVSNSGFMTPGCLPILIVLIMVGAFMTAVLLG